MKDQLYRLNYLCIIDSLPDNLQTGELLFRALKGYHTSGHYHGIKDIVRKPVNNLDEWNRVVSDLNNEIKYNHMLPYVHIEMHGDGVSGLSLRSGEIIRWERLFDQLQELNYNTHNYLFLTLGVCHGLNISFFLRIHDRSPFLGAVGSFLPSLNTDLLKQFALFYDEILSSADVEVAFQKLNSVQVEIESDYRYIDTIGLFRKVYMRYLREECSRDGIQKRIAETFPSFLRMCHIIFPSRRVRRFFKNHFIRLLKKNQNREYRRAYRRFLMVDVFPENEDRFKMPDNVYDFRHKRTDFIEEA